MDFEQERRILVEVERHIAEAKKLIARQRVIVQRENEKHPSAEAPQSTLNSLESSLRMFETHRQRLLELMGTSSAESK